VTDSPAALFAAALALGLVAVVVARRLALATGFVAQPNPLVTAHRAPVPYLGGLAMFVPYAALVAFLPAFAAAPGGGSGAVRRALATLAFALVGTWDDLRPFWPRWKLLAQIVIAAVYLTFRGVTNPAWFVGELLGLLVLMNAFNLVDVMDGLLCLVGALAIAGLWAMPGAVSVALVPEYALALGVVAAFFAFNRPQARIYAGDAGSLALGFLVGTWLLESAHVSTPVVRTSLLGAVAVPLFELSLLFVARASRGASPFHGSPDHFALRLQDQRGWSKPRVLAVTAMTGAVAALAPWIAMTQPRMVALAFAAILLAIAIALWIVLWGMPPRPDRILHRATSASATRV
jgi:UDP-GlcNAc:undecaprenyl-phosphate GlcNAc-1-phosphate transferase